MLHRFSFKSEKNTEQNLIIDTTWNVALKFKCETLTDLIMHKTTSLTLRVDHNLF